MSKLEELIEQYCPDGVEYLRLDKVANVCRGTRVVKSQLSDTGYPVYQNCLTPMGYFERSNCNAGTTFVICGGAAGNVGYTDVDCWAADDCEFIIGSNQVINRYIYYYLMTKQNYLLSKVRKASIPRLSPNIIKELEIPVPPLPVQEEIVRVLDTFTELQAELQAELQKRKQQYNYYLDNLLNFNNINRGGYQEEQKNLLNELIQQYCPDGVEWKTFAEVFETITDYTAAGSFKNIAENVQYLKMPDYALLIRTTDLKSNFTKGGFIYVSKSAFNYLWRVNMDKECIVMPNVGNCGEIYYVQPQDLPYEHCALAPNAILVRSNAHNNRYLSYCLQVEDFQRQLNKITSPVGQSKFNKTELKKLVIPVPPLPVQEEIARILDKFNILVNDLTSGLPAEIEKRKQQYEYYRDKLLTFKRKGA